MNDLDILAKLRLIVGYLGENHSHKWWNSEFFGASAQAFLAPLFQRSLLLAQYNGVVMAAAKVHDEVIGVGQVYHLFRLPIWFEQSLADWFTVESNQKEISRLLQQPEILFDELRQISNSKKLLHTGPCNVEVVTTETITQRISEIASLYLNGFETQTAVMPYFRVVL